jgi:hypothetical protein
MSIKNARILGVRLDEKTTARVAIFEQKTHIEAVSLARASLLAALDYFDATGSLSLPLQITPATHTEEKIAGQKNANLLESLQCAPPAPSRKRSPSTGPVPTTANIVRLPPPPVIATLLHDMVSEKSTPSPVTEPRSEARYEKKRRKA